jgi:hypothetical protein
VSEQGSTIRVCQLCNDGFQEEDQSTDDEPQQPFEPLPEQDKRPLITELADQTTSVQVSDFNTTTIKIRPDIPAKVPNRMTKKPNAGNRHLGMTAANHMQLMMEELLEKHAPLLTDRKVWINQLLSLATRCCATVDPNVKKGDLLDIRPYCKIKVIPGGSFRDCAYGKSLHMLNLSNV